MDDPPKPWPRWASKHKRWPFPEKNISTQFWELVNSGTKARTYGVFLNYYIETWIYFYSTCFQIAVFNRSKTEEWNWNENMLRFQKISGTKVLGMTYFCNLHSYTYFQIYVCCSCHIPFQKGIRPIIKQGCRNRAGKNYTPFENAKRWLGKIHSKFCF